MFTLKAAHVTYRNEGSKTNKDDQGVSTMHPSGWYRPIPRRALEWRYFSHKNRLVIKDKIFNQEVCQ